MKIIACFKWVIDEADIIVEAKTNSLVFDKVSYKISNYDLNAIEEAALLAEKTGGQAIGLTLGTPAARNSLKNALSRGLESTYFVNDASFENLDASQTAKYLAATIKGRTEYDLILCGEGSSDMYAQQVGPRLAEELGIPCVTYVNKIVPEDGKTISVWRKLEEEQEIVQVQSPVVITVLPDINQPRIPSLKQVLGASKKAISELGLQDLGSDVQNLESGLMILGTKAATTDRKQLKFGADEEGIKAVLAHLQKDGVL